MKGLWFVMVAMLLPLNACEKRKGTLLPPRNETQKTSQQTAAAASPHRQELRARSIMDEMMEDETIDKSLGSMGEEDIKDLEKVKEDALARIKKNPKEKPVRSGPSGSKASALYQRGRQLIGKGRFDEGQEYFLVACQLGYPEGCHKFGWHEERLGNYKNARQFYRIACESGYGKSCNNLGFQLERFRRWDEAMDFYAMACLEKQNTGCSNLKRLRQEKLKLR